MASILNPRIAELDNVYFQQTMRLVRSAGVFLPVVVVTLGLLTRAGILDKTYYLSDAIFAAISIAVILVGIMQWINGGRDLRISITATTCFHILGGAFILFVTGINSLLMIVWIVLYIGTDIFYGTRGSIASAAALLAIFLLDGAVHPHETLTEAATIMLTVLMTFVAEVVITRLRLVDEQERRAFNASRREEILQHERLTALINAMGDAVVSTDEHGVIRVYNAATLSLLDTNATLTGQKIDSVLHLVDDKRGKVNLMSYVKANDHVFSRRDLHHVYNKDDQISLYINVSPIRPSYEQQDIQSGYIFILRDITKEKSLEEERDEFISVASHELRTPVAIMEGNISNAQLMLSREPGANQKIVEEALATSHDQALYLSKMINDLSTLSRAERGVADTPEIIDVTELLQEMYHEYRPQAEAKKLHLNLDLGPRLGTVEASRLYLAEVLQNFVTNAIKYTPKGSITLKAERQGSYIEFSVTDSGIGISKSDQRHIFEKFFRSEDYRTRETSGTGLGLYVVQKLAHKLGIKVEFESRLNHGSTFHFRLKT